MSIEAISLKRYRSPRTVIARFVTRRTAKSAAFWALGFGVYVASKAAGFAAAYPDAKARAAIASTFGNNVGLDAILGRPRDMSQLAGVTVWNTLGIMTLIGSIWALLLATRLFRGEEETGRSELLLTGQTTMKQAAINTLIGIAATIGTLFVVSATAFVLVGQIHTVDFSVSAGIFFALSLSMGTLVFACVGALASQLMPTRTRAATVSTVALGIFFLLRAAADTTSATWLANVTPFGWVDNLRPLYDSRPLWLVPLFGLALVLSIATVWLAARRDLGDSVFADKDSARPRYSLLGSAFTSALRLTRAKTFGWLLGTTFIAFAFGRLTQSAVTAFNASASSEHVIAKIAKSAQNETAVAFIGISFFLVMLLMMCYAASAVGAIRDTEAQGYVDNLLVRAVGRPRWLGGRFLLVILSLLLMGLLATLGVMLGVLGENLGVSNHSLIEAGMNTLAAPIFTLGVGIGAFGYIPRLTTVLSYSVVGWSFLLEMISSGLNLNHWLLDTSVFYHIGLAPATNPRWGSAVILIVLGCACALLGTWRFSKRDLQNE